MILVPRLLSSATGRLTPGLAASLLVVGPLVVGPTAIAQDAFPAATPESQGLSGDALEALATEVAGYVDRDQAVGAELLVIQNRRTVLHRYFGFADREKGERWDETTVCNIRSMTKTLTGAAIQLLVDRGELALDDPAATYLPGFDTDAARAITVRQLLTHRAGLPLSILEAIDQYPSLLDMANAVGARGPEREPDSRFWYSDSGTDALGAIVEVVSKRRVDEFVHDELLAPLGMEDSFYYLSVDDSRRARVASLYIGGQNAWTRFLDPDEKPLYPYAWGSQSLYSTPEDYARFLAMWMDGGRVGDHQLLSEAAVARTLTPASEMSMLGSEARFPTSFRGLEVFYGQMAVLHAPVDDDGAPGPVRIIGHSGSDGTIAWAWPDRDLMVLYFTQSRGGSTALRLEEVLDRLLIQPDAYGNDDVPAEFEPYLGTYVADWSNHMKEEFVVSVRGGKLSLDIPSQMVFELAPADEDGKWVFAVAPDALTLWFGHDEAGEVDRLFIHQGITFEAPRQGTPRDAELAAENLPDPEVVGRYFGIYHDPEQEVDVEVRIDRDYLAIRTSERTFHLWKIPVADAWQVRENPMVKITFQEEDGEVVSFTREARGAGKVVFDRKR